MKKIVTKQVEIEVCDFCEKEVSEHNNWCGICNKSICENHQSEYYSEDGCICLECVKKGFTMGYDTDGDLEFSKIYLNGKRYNKETYF